MREPVTTISSRLSASELAAIAECVAADIAAAPRMAATVVRTVNLWIVVLFIDSPRRKKKGETEKQKDAKADPIQGGRTSRRRRCVGATLALGRPPERRSSELPKRTPSAPSALVGR
jgi:hypothetical protein